jgi:hypothetical protein
MKISPKEVILAWMFQKLEQTQHCGAKLVALTLKDNPLVDGELGDDV